MRAAFQLRYWILGLGFRVLGLSWDNGKENGNYYSILWLYWDNGKEKGNYYSIWGLYCHNGKENGNYRSRLGVIFGAFEAVYVAACNARARVSGLHAVSEVNTMQGRYFDKRCCPHLLVDLPGSWFVIVSTFGYASC